MSSRGLLLALDYPPAGGGIARLLEGWTLDTDLLEWRILTVTPGFDSSRVTRTSLRSLVPATIIDGAAWLRQADDRVVLAGHPYLAGLAVALAPLLGARSACATFGRELVARNLAHRLSLAALFGVGRVIAISDHTARLAVRAGARTSCVAVVRPRLRPPWLAERAPHRRSTPNGLRLVALARLSEGYKNLELLIRLCSVLHPIGIVERMTVIGGGPRLGALQEKVLSLGLSDTIDFVGHLPDEAIGSLLIEHDIGVFPSRDSIAERGFEGFGLVVHELAAAGLPVLVGAAAGAFDAVAGSWSWLLDPDDLWSWVSAVEDLYSDEARRWTMGDAALEWARLADPIQQARIFATALVGQPTGGGDEYP